MSWQGSEHSLVIMGCQRSVHSLVIMGWQRSVHSLVIMSWQRSVHSLVIMSWRGSVHSQGHYELQRAASPDCVQNTQEVKRKMNWSGFKPGSVWWPAKCFTAGPGPFPNQGLCGVWAVNIEFCNQILFSTKNVCLLRFTIAMTFGGGGRKTCVSKLACICGISTVFGSFGEHERNQPLHGCLRGARTANTTWPLTASTCKNGGHTGDLT